MPTMVDVYADPTSSVMLDKLCEGDIGRYFAEYRRNNGVYAASIIMHATQTYQANRRSWDNVGAFACNYHFMVIAVMEPHVGQYPQGGHKGPNAAEEYKIALIGWHSAILDTWAEFVRDLAFGGK